MIPVARAAPDGVRYPRSCGRMPERPKGAVCKIAGVAYGGSNPPPPTHSPANGRTNERKTEPLTCTGGQTRSAHPRQTPSPSARCERSGKTCSTGRSFSDDDSSTGSFVATLSITTPSARTEDLSLQSLMAQRRFRPTSSPRSREGMYSVDSSTSTTRSPHDWIRGYLHPSALRSGLRTEDP